jgi:hypothetical protein
MQVAGELRHPEPDGVVAAGARAFRELREKDIVIGVKRV